MDESDISKWDNNIERWRSADYDILNETVEGKPYSDDELREKFRNGYTIQACIKFDTLYIK